MTTETDNDKRRPRRSTVWQITRRVLKITGITLASLFLLTFLLLVIVRFYFNDERLRTIAQDKGRDTLNAEVSIGALEISLWSGFELRDVRLGPPAGFTRDPLAFRRLALHWSAADLLRLHVVLPEVALEGVRLTLEENAEGQNLQILLAKVKGPAKPPVEKPPEPTERKPLVLEQPTLPVRVEIRRLALTVDSVEIIKPTQDMAIDKIGMQGHLEGEGQTMSLDLWLGLGDRELGGAPSHFRMRGGKPFAAIDSEQRFGVTLKSSGLGDLALQVGLQAETQLRGEQSPPPLKTDVDIATTLDLLAQRFELPTFRIRLGEGTELDAKARGEGILTTPAVRIDALRFKSDLAELAPLIAALAPGVVTTGRCSASAEPFDVITDKTRMETTAATLRLGLEQVGVKLPNMSVSDLTLQSTFTAASGALSMHVDATLGRYAAGTQEALRIAAVMDLSTPLAPWLGGPAEGVVDIRGRFGLKRYTLPSTSVADLDMLYDLVTPVALIKKEPTAPSLTTHMLLRIGDTTSVGYTVKNLRTTIDATAWDLAARRLQTRLSGTMSDVRIPYGEETISLGSTTMGMEMTRNGNDYAFAKAVVDSGDAFRMQWQGAIKDAVGPAPIFDAFSWTLGPTDLTKTLALLPESQRPKAAIGGRLAMSLSLQGCVAYKELIPKTKPPKVDAAQGKGDISKMMAGYSEFLQSWEAEFARGMPFTTAFTFSLKDVSFVDDQNEARGISMEFGFALDEHSPHLSYTLDVAEVQKPVVARGISMGIDFALSEGLVTAGYRLRAAALERDNLTGPLQNAGMDLKLSYRIGGDLLLDRFLMEAPDRGLTLEASGVMSKPLQFVLARGWERPGLPGLDATLRGAMALDAGEQKPITKGGPELGGKVGLSGTLRTVDGVIGIDGVLDTDHLSYVSGPTAVEELSGALPFDLKLAFDARPDATILKRGIAIGGGVVALVTSGEDIRRRPARPAYYERIRPYRQRPGLSARSIKSGDYEITDFELEGRLTQGMLLADSMSMHILGGDVTGNMALQLGRDATVRGDIAFKVSNIDASYFKALSLKPGPDSELSADMQLGLLLGPKSRDLTMNMNITKIGSLTFDRFLQLLDPTAKDQKLQDTRKNLSYVRIDNVGLWMRYESLNMNLDVTTFLRIPATTIGFPNIDRELLRRYSLTDRLDEIFNPLNEKYLVPYLGWNRAG
jgi:hypothetical protein